MSQPPRNTIFISSGHAQNMAVVVNKPIPEFEAQATGGIKVSNQTHLGQTVILYFYPKDNTPGCTTEAMQFRDKYKDFVKAGAQVFGVSRDNMKSHDDFKTKLELPFELIDRLKAKMPLFTTAPMPMLPLVPPAPTCSVPPDMVVPP